MITTLLITGIAFSLLILQVLKDRKDYFKWYDTKKY